jgi:hypothetical protein
VGTPAFMSPEQVRGDDLDGRSDLFSTGLILHDLLCGRSPYYSDNPGTSLMKVLQEDVPGMFDVLFGVDPLVEGFHAKLTAKERNHRFGTAAQALSVLTPYLTTIRAQYPSLVADCIRDPVGMKQRLLREHAEAEMGRALALVQRHGPIHAAALALENAVHIDPSLSIAQQRLGELSTALGFHTEVVADPRITEAEEALRAQPQHPGLIKRLADLHRAAGNMRESARFLKRYLRLKDDSAAVQQLLALLWGPGADPILVTRTVSKLSTQDIVAGLKTGGMPALKPDKPLKERAAAGLTSQQKAAIADAAQRRSGATGTNAQPSPKTGGFYTSSDEARHIASMSEDGIFESLRDRFGAFFWPSVAVTVILVIVLSVAKLSSSLVSSAQADMKKHVEGEAIHEEDTVFNLQTTKLNEARAALASGSFVACASAAQMAQQGEKTAKIVLDAKWLIAQCSLLAGDVMAARDALQDFKDNANIRDKRFELANTQLRAIERGEKPGGIREW